MKSRSFKEFDGSFNWDGDDLLFTEEEMEEVRQESREIQESFEDEMMRDFMDVDVDPETL